MKDKFDFKNGVCIDYTVDGTFTKPQDNCQIEIECTNPAPGFMKGITAAAQTCGVNLFPSANSTPAKCKLWALFSAAPPYQAKLGAMAAILDFLATQPGFQAEVEDARIKFAIAPQAISTIVSATPAAAHPAFESRNKAWLQANAAALNTTGLSATAIEGLKGAATAGEIEGLLYDMRVGCNGYSPHPSLDPNSPPLSDYIRAAKQWEALAATRTPCQTP